MKKYVMKAVIAGLCVYIAACTLTGVKATNPQQAVFEIKQSYELALTVAVAYDNLPACTPGVVICSTPAGKQKIKQAKDVASPVIQGAENAVRDPNFDKNTANAVITAAQAAVVALTAVTAALPHK